MNKSLLCKLLGLVAVLIGASMVFSLPWALPIRGGDWRHEQEGFIGLVGSIVICFAVGIGLRYLGRNGSSQLFRKEAMAVVGLSWVLATVLGSLSFMLGGKPVEDQGLRKNVLVYFGLILAIFAVSWLLTITLEPNSTWTDHGHAIEHKLIDRFGLLIELTAGYGQTYGTVLQTDVTCELCRALLIAYPPPKE